MLHSAPDRSLMVCVPCGCCSLGPATGANGQNHPAAAGATKGYPWSRTRRHCHPPRVVDIANSSYWRAAPVPSLLHRWPRHVAHEGRYAPRAGVSTDDLDSSMGPWAYDHRGRHSHGVLLETRPRVDRGYRNPCLEAFGPVRPEREPKVISRACARLVADRRPGPGGGGGRGTRARAALRFLIAPNPSG